MDHHFGWGAALEIDGAWTVLIEVEPLRTFGQALLAGTRNGAAAFDAIVSGDAGGVARRAGLFRPEATVWEIDGTDLVAAQPVPISTLSEPKVDAHLAELLQSVGVELIIEHGEVIGECRGLEVARVVSDADGQRLEVGVGAYDQDAFAIMNPALATHDALDSVVAQVLSHRRSGVEPHPMNRLVRERWIRSDLISNPSSVGLVSLRAIEAVVPRQGLNDVAPAFALGVDTRDSRVLVACSVGIDLDLIPAATDLGAHHQVDLIVVVLPERDQHRSMLELAELALCPCKIVTADEPWA